ncbi:MAG TPA: NAD-dependent epimerase/dehydratase family protein [Opitutaceae bacterium]|nr:NAD-dependent epimerase/dehydratase family protein [Opitutaceae bacterium]
MSSDALGKFEGKRLVIFGAGYVGTALAASALEAGAHVVALTRNHETAHALAAIGASTIQAEVDSHEWHDRIEKMDMVVNCVSSAGGGIAGYEKSYVNGASSILAWLEKTGGTESLVYTSSTSVYPQVSGVVDETSSTAEATGSAKLLLEAEALLLGSVACGKAVRATILRLAGIYGPGRHHLLDHLRAEPARAFAGKGNHLLNLIFRDDIVSAIEAALLRHQGLAAETYNVTDGHPVLKEDLARWLAAQIGRPFPGFSGESSGGRRADSLNRAISNEKLKRELDWAPRFPDFQVGYRAILGA